MQKNIFIIALQDFLTKKFLALTFVPFITSFALLALIYANIDININYFSDYEFLNSILEFLIDVLGWLLLILFSTLLATIIMGFFTPIVIKEIHKRHYSHLSIDPGMGIVEYLTMVAKIILKSIGIFLLSILLYFIPLLNAVALNLPFYYFFHSFLCLDVGGELMSKNELEKILKKYRLKVMSTTGILYLITLIPFAGMFLQVYFISVMTHLFFRLR